MWFDREKLDLCMESNLESNPNLKCRFFVDRTIFLVAPSVHVVLTRIDQEIKFWGRIPSDPDESLKPSNAIDVFISWHREPWIAQVLTCRETRLKGTSRPTRYCHISRLKRDTANHFQCVSWKPAHFVILCRLSLSFFFCFVTKRNKTFELICSAAINQHVIQWLPVVRSTNGSG